MILVLHVLLLSLVFIRSPWFKVKGIPLWYVPAILFLKVLAGYAIARYYERVYHGGDIQGYLADAATLHGFFSAHPVAFFKLIFGIDEIGGGTAKVVSQLKIWHNSGYSSQYNDARTVIRFHALLAIFSGDNEWVHLIWSNVLSIAGCLTLLRFVFSSGQTEVCIPRVVFLIFFFPDLFIWSSAILKEPLLLFSMGMTLRYFQRWIYFRRKKELFLLLVYTGCFLLIKSFWLLAFLPGMLVWMISPRLKRPVLTFSFTYIFLLIVVFIAGKISPAFDLPSLLFGQQLNFWRYAVFMKSGSLIHPLPFAPVFSSFLWHIPGAFAYAAFQPWQIERWVHLPLLLENLIFPMLFIRCILVFLKYRSLPAAEIVLCFLAGGIMMVVCGFTTPVIGSLIRYRMPGLLLLLLACFQYGYRPAERDGSKPVSDS